MVNVEDTYSFKLAQMYIAAILSYALSVKNIERYVQNSFVFIAQTHFLEMKT